ncbi:Mitochondrial metalloendopeptidase OMA1 [Golovinomyces cichoracearum]|uniref:Mitochondrial metalloendopeptidase OMA1 n=1 Tax=Golovinomyces cichoracearum TaxID=62708 RepID=A0A420HEL1_9PEZI|nr:Mitochondrial metalloendopeptidase OMA1 [Golovinomyces cichoracearum]
MNNTKGFDFVLKNIIKCSKTSLNSRSRCYLRHVTLNSPWLKVRPISHTAASYSLPSRQPGRFDPVEAQRAKPLITGNQISNILTHRYAKCIYVFIAGGAVIFYFKHLETAPVSGRRRFMYFTDADAEEEGQILYDSIMQEFRHAILPSWDQRTQQVNRVMKRLVTASGLAHIEWEVNVISSNAPNAFVIPGGKVFVMSGILPIAQTDAGLAAVLSHEIAHGIASHQAERMSSAIMIIWPLRVLFFLFFDIWSFGLLGNFLLEFGLNRPASRTQEREADFIGLVMMAKACYDPKAAVNFWRRMEMLEAAQGKQELPWLSTHPSTASRVELINKWLPIAEAVRAKTDCSIIRRYTDRFIPTIGYYWPQ